MNAPWNPGPPCFCGCVLFDGGGNGSRNDLFKPECDRETDFVPRAGLEAEDVAEVDSQWDVALCIPVIFLSAGEYLCGSLMLNRGVKQWGKGTRVLHRSRRAVPSDLAVLPEKKKRGITAAVSSHLPSAPGGAGEVGWGLLIVFNLFSTQSPFFTFHPSKSFDFLLF